MRSTAGTGARQNAGNPYGRIRQAHGRLRFCRKPDAQQVPCPGDGDVQLRGRKGELALARPHRRGQAIRPVGEPHRHRHRTGSHSQRLHGSFLFHSLPVWAQTARGPLWSPRRWILPAEDEPSLGGGPADPRRFRVAPHGKPRRRRSLRDHPPALRARRDPSHQQSRSFRVGGSVRG